MLSKSHNNLEIILKKLSWCLRQYSENTWTLNPYHHHCILIPSFHYWDMLSIYRERIIQIITAYGFYSKCRWLPVQKSFSFHNCSRTYKMLCYNAGWDFFRTGSLCLERSLLILFETAHWNDNMSMISNLSLWVCWLLQREGWSHGYSVSLVAKQATLKKINCGEGIPVESHGLSVKVL